MTTVADTPPAPRAPDDRVAIQLGPFRLLHRIGRGGMGDVWAGRHADEDVMVALKILTGGALLRPAFHELFRNEIRAFAGLDHPNIVTIYDYGRTPTAFDPAGDVAPNVPWFAMELCDGGSLRDHRGTLEWNEVRGSLLAVLDALAHAHARGVIHRDIKPANVLLTTARARAKLSDFGLAHMVERDSESSPDFATGTPAYMAPEQVLARVRDQGPWTDLYAVGCLAFSMLSGSAPFSELGPQQAAIAQLQRPLPHLPKRFDVPDGLDEWIERLTDKEPRRRFRRAADAAWALLQLEAPMDQPVVEVDDDPTVDLRGDRDQTGATLEVLALEAGQRGPRQGGLRGGLRQAGVRIADLRDTPVARPPIPANWRRSDALRVTRHLGGTGLELFRLRTTPMVDRTAERDALWALLRECASSQEIRVAILRGPAGIGKTRLAHWLVERAHELGSAQWFHGTHRPTPEPLDGLGGMMVRATRTEGLSGAEVSERCRSFLRRIGVMDPDETLALTEVVSPGGQPDDRGRRIRFRSPRERYALLTRIFARLTQERPLALVLDDGQWGEDSLGFVEFLVKEAPQAGPILVLVTVGEEALESRPVESRRLSEIEAHETATRTLRIERLHPDDHRHLVQELLGLEPQIARGIAEHTAGNPLFAVQVVGSWVEGGHLEPGPDGFRLKPGVDIAMPEHLLEVWSARVEQGLHGLPPEAEEAVEAGAALGLDVDTREWTRVCWELGRAPSFEAIERLTERGLVTPSGPGLRVGWSFSHVMLRESVLLRSKKSGRIRKLHRACAVALEELDGPLAGERAGRHYLRAHAWESALIPLLEAARARRKRGENEAAILLLDGRDRALQALEGPSPTDTPDARRGEGWLERARIDLALGRHDETRRWIARIEDAPGSGDAWTALRANAWVVEGSRLRWLGLIDAAWRALKRAEEALLSIGAPGLLPRVWEGMGEVLSGIL